MIECKRALLWPTALAAIMLGAAGQQLAAPVGPPPAPTSQLATGEQALAFAAAAAGPLYAADSAPSGWQQQQQQQAKLDGLLAKLAELEAAGAASAAACARWTKLNRRYGRLAGAHRGARPGEPAMGQRCQEAQLLAGPTEARLDNFRRLLQAEGGQLEFAGGLVAEYARLRQAMGADEQLAREYARTLETWPQVAARVASLESFVSYVLDTFATIPENSAELAAAPAASGGGRPSEPGEPSGAKEAPNEAGDIAQLDAELRRLIDRERALGETEFRRLNELAAILERVLADRGAVEVNSGRFRYLSGTLDGARAVIVRRLNAASRTGERHEPAVPDYGQPQVSAHDGALEQQRPAASNFLDEQQQQQLREFAPPQVMDLDEAGPLEASPVGQDEGVDLEREQQMEAQRQLEEAAESAAMAVNPGDLAGPPMMVRPERADQAQQPQQQQQQAPNVQVLAAQPQMPMEQPLQRPPMLQRLRQQRQQQQQQQQQRAANQQRRAAEWANNEQEPLGAAPGKQEQAPVRPQAVAPPAVPDKLKRLRQRNFADFH